jgi:hypothetical protein
MPGDVEVQNASTTMSDDKEAMQHTGSDRWHGEEVHRRDGFPVISKKGEPPLRRFGISRGTPHPTGDRSPRDIKTEHEKFTMDAWRAPRRILNNHPEDQLSNLLRRLSSPSLCPRSGDQTPVQAETGSVPPDHRFRVDHDKRLFPPGPEPSRQDPKKLIE